MNKSMPTISELENLRDLMLDIGVRMEYYGGLDYIAEHGLQMVGASKVLQTWIDGIKELKNLQ